MILRNLLLTVILLSLPLAGMAETGRLADLLGWDIPGSGEVQVKDVSSKDGVTAGTIQIGNINIQTQIFATKGLSKPSIGLVFEDINLGSLLPFTRDLPGGNLQLKSPVFIIVHEENLGKPVTLPNDLKTRLEKSGMLKGNQYNPKKSCELNCLASIKQLDAGMLQQLGIMAKDGLKLTGTISPEFFRALDGKSAGKELMQLIINSIDLEIPVDNPKPTWLPNQLKAANAALRLTGRDGSLQLAVKSDLTLTLNRKSAVFKDADISYAGGSGITSLAAPAIDVSQLFAIPVQGISLSLPRMALAGEFGKNLAKLSLAGEIVAGSEKTFFSAELAVNDKSDNFTLSISGNLDPNKLPGFKMPLFDGIKLSALTFGKNEVSGSGAINNLNFDLSFFNTPAKKLPNIALDLKINSLQQLIPALAGTLASDIRINKGSLIYVPEGNQGTVSSPPAKVQESTGEKSLQLKPGINLFARVGLSGQLKNLLDLTGIKSLELPMTGGFDPSLLKTGGAGSKIASEIINQIDLKIPIGAISLPGLPPFIESSDNALSLKGKEGKLTGTIMTKLTVTLDQVRHVFACSISRDIKDGSDCIIIDGQYQANGGSMKNLFGLTWLEIKNAALHLELGKNRVIRISGMTSVGKIKNLKAETFFKMTGDTIVDAGIRLLGADIPLSELPGVGQIPGMDKIKFRDLTVSSASFAGTVLTAGTPLAFLDRMSSVLFQNGKGWSLAIMKEKFGLADIFPALPEVVRSIFKDIRFTMAAFVVSSSPADCRISDLPVAAQEAMLRMYGDNSTRIKLPDGLGLIAAISPEALIKQFGHLNIDFNNLVFSGSLGGIFSGSPAFEIAAVIPPLKLPQTFDFLVMPKNVQCRFFLRLRGIEAALGAGIAMVTDFGGKDEPAVQLETGIDFQVDTRGGFTVVLRGETLSDWHNPLGIKGFSLNTGTLLAFEGSASSNIRLIITGNSHIRDRVIKLSGAIDIIGGQAPAALAMEGAVSELGTEDLFSMVNKVAAATGAKPVQSGLPPITLTGVDLAFASPGTIGAQYDLDEGGVRIEGDLWFLLKNEALGSVRGKVTTRGLEIHGKVGEFQLGPVRLKDNRLDTKVALSFPPEPPYFKIIGQADLFGKSNEAAINAEVNELEVHSNLDFGKLLKFDFKARMGIPSKSVDPKELAKFDMSLDSRLISDIPGWLRTDGKEAVGKVFSTIEESLKTAQQGIDLGKSHLKGLDDQISKARDEVKKDHAGGSKAIDRTNKQIDTLKSQLNDLDKQIKKEEGAIKKCNQTRKIAIAWNLKGKVIKTAVAPDFEARARCRAENIKHQATATTLKIEKVAAQKSLELAKKGLEELKKGINSDTTIDIDPRVAPLLVQYETEKAMIEASQLSISELKKADAAVKSALDQFARSNLFVLKEAVISGSLQKALAGKPAILAISFVIGKEEHLKGMAISFTDPVFTAGQFEAIALLLAQEVVRLSVDAKKSPPQLLDMLESAYSQKAAAVEEELHKALKEHGLE